MNEYLLYITKNLITGEVYGGKHTGKQNDGYIGSGPSKLIPAIQKFGKENFKCRYLKLKIKDEAHLDRLEMRLIRLLKFIWKDKCYNVHTGDSGGFLLRYASPEFREEVNKRIAEGKKKQYANGETELQIKGRKRQSHTLKTKNQGENGRCLLLNWQRRKGFRLSERQRTQGLTAKEIKRNEQTIEQMRKYIKFEAISADNIIIASENRITSTDLSKKYNLEECIVTPMIKQGVYTIKRRTLRTRHNFPVGTVLKNLGYVNTIHVSKARVSRDWAYKCSKRLICGCQKNK